MFAVSEIKTLKNSLQHLLRRLLTRATTLEVANQPVLSPRTLFLTVLVIIDMRTCGLVLRTTLDSTSRKLFSAHSLLTNLLSELKQLVLLLQSALLKFLEVSGLSYYQTFAIMHLTIKWKSDLLLCKQLVIFVKKQILVKLKMESRIRSCLL